MAGFLCSRLLFLRALTPVHAGVGRSGEIIDLPVQRDEFGFPCIWSSSLKGAIRSALTRAVSGSRDGKCLKVVFGAEPRTREVSEYPSHASLFDARLLFIPMRSLKGIWVYGTSPHLIGYLNLYLEGTGRTVPDALRNVGVNTTSNREIMVRGGVAVLNEEWINLSVEQDLVDKLFSGVLPNGLMKRVKSRGLVILDDNTMKSLIGRSMLVQYRVMLSRKTKTVETGPWAEEYLPEETVLISGAVGRTPDSSLLKKAECMLKTSVCDWLVDKLNSSLRNRLWLGGKETLGRGLLEIHVA